MRLKEYWWKILCVLIFLYVLIIGMITPLKPGVLDTDLSFGKAGELQVINVSTYNTNHKKSGLLRAWLKLDSVHAVRSHDIRVNADNQLALHFNIPNHMPTKDSLAQTTLVIDSNKDGYMLLPNAFTIKQDSIDINKGQLAWSKEQIDNLHLSEGLSFPFRNILYETIRNTFFHVSLWFAMFIILIISLVYSVMYLRKPSFRCDVIASSLTDVAIVFGLLGIVTGSIWAKYTWGTFWTTDVKLNMSATALLIYLAYWILRSSIKDQDRRARTAAVYSIFAFLALIPLVFVIPRMMDSLHPGNGGNPALGGEDMDNTLRMVFYPAIIGFTLLGLWISSLFIRFRLVEHKVLLNENNT